MVKKISVLAFSGGKDSTVLHYLVDMAIPGNKIPRVFINTGIEYNAIKEFVATFEDDSRFTTIRPEYPLGKVFKLYGYPFKSKEHSDLVKIYQHGGMCKTIDRYINPPEERKRYGCPKILKYQFNEGTDLKISKECCNKLKKEPFNKYQKETNHSIKMTGERKAEGGLRSTHGDCLAIDKNGVLKKFKPLNPVTDEWLDWFIKEYDIKLCKLYYPPYNFKRTGCKGCPYNIRIGKDLATMRELMPTDYKQCINLWKPVYKEYIRIGYRIKEDLYDTPSHIDKQK